MYCHLKAAEHEGLKTYSTLVEEYTPVEASSFTVPPAMAMAILLAEDIWGSTHFEWPVI